MIYPAVLYHEIYPKDTTTDALLFNEQAHFYIILFALLLVVIYKIKIESNIIIPCSEYTHYMHYLS